MADFKVVYNAPWAAFSRVVATETLEATDIVEAQKKAEAHAKELTELREQTVCVYSVRQVETT